MKLAIRKYWREAVAVLALIVLALGIGGYIISQQRVRFPLVEEAPKRLAVELSRWDRSPTSRWRTAWRWCRSRSTLSTPT